MKTHSLLILSLFIALQSCVLLDEHVPADEVEVVYQDQEALELKPLVDYYFKEATKRDVFFKNKKVTIHTKEYHGINGKGNPMTSDVIINKASKNWKEFQDGNNASMLSTLAHEFGHALLGYHHRGNGKLKYHGEFYRNSIMTSTNWGVPSLEKKNNEIWEYYFDELFHLTDIENTYTEDSSNSRSTEGFESCDHDN
ncbi:hypothetical protein [Flammeovirga pacifica]|uniref:Uncharacterized protein n=1 Tax=Flammeovirga pacifica TaxID=915059 RepID=A0A1S1Z0V5_FLAPC|nr:hypothetical protein [Flammeovirga pacifica]OHX66899.1 hypothetical protein NH26_11315 [Flammeovirga pacifica]